VSGTVQAVSISSIGQVVMPGEEVMRMVPSGVGVEIECYMPNKDIGFVAVGQEAVVKVESFPFARYGTLRAHVTRVGVEAIPEPDAQQPEADAAKPGKSTLSGGAQRMQNLVFPVTLSLVDLFADRTSTAKMKANQLRLWFASMAYVLVESQIRLGIRSPADRHEATEFAAVHESAAGRAPRRRESPVEEDSTQRVVD
jgi:hypothetical protein